MENPDMDFEGWELASVARLDREALEEFGPADCSLVVAELRHGEDLATLYLPEEVALDLAQRILKGGDDSIQGD